MIDIVNKLHSVHFVDLLPFVRVNFNESRKQKYKVQVSWDSPPICSDLKVNVWILEFKGRVAHVKMPITKCP